MSEPMTTADWIAIDWGTSRLRAWACSGDGRVLQQAASTKGMSSLTSGLFEAALLDLIEDWLAPDQVTTVIACGMVGARQGWIEAPYTEVPCTPLAADRMVAAPVQDPRLRVLIVPGLCQSTPADVMRGEETQLAGCLVDEGVVCLPGTHCKWVQLSQGSVLRFQTFMTGELFALLSEQSVLRHGLQLTGGADSEWDDAAFISGAEKVLVSPQDLPAALFGLRASGLLHDLAPAAARSRLSGLLIGAELAAARPFWDGRTVSMVGDSGLPALYARVLRARDVEVRTLDVEAVTLAGLRAAYGHSLERSINR